MYVNVIIFLFINICYSICYSMHIPCVDYNDNCYYQPCCKPYICYEETVCIYNNKTNST